MVGMRSAGSPLETRSLLDGLVEPTSGSWSSTRHDDATAGSGSSARLRVQRGQPRVQSGQAHAQLLRQRHIPRVMGGEAPPELPHTGGEGRIGEESDVEPEQVGVGQRGRVGRDLPGHGSPAKDVRDLHRHQVRCGQVVAAEDLLRPRPVRASVYKGGDDEGGIDDQRHGRSASRWSRICSADSRLAVRAFRSWIRKSSASGSGRLASSMSCPRRYSCGERPVRAPLAASSSRVSTGTSRMVMDLLMNALCCDQPDPAGPPVPARARPADPSASSSPIRPTLVREPIDQRPVRAALRVPRPLKGTQ